MSAILKFDFQERKQLHSSKENYLNYTKKTQFCMFHLHFPKTRGNKNKQWTHLCALKSSVLCFILCYGSLVASHIDNSHIRRRNRIHVETKAPQPTCMTTF